MVRSCRKEITLSVQISSSGEIWLLPAVIDRSKKIIAGERGLKSHRETESSYKNHVMAVFKPQGCNSGHRSLWADVVRRNMTLKQTEECQD